MPGFCDAPAARAVTEAFLRHSGAQAALPAAPPGMHAHTSVPVPFAHRPLLFRLSCLPGRARAQGGVCVRARVRACVHVPPSWHSWRPIQRVRRERVPGPASQRRRGPGGSALGRGQR